ncbi:RNA polymerase subunit sigma [Candidatus Nomurabacteria bacterium RIFCSPLOWO2_01_FULL_33_24]|uniref:RNA polymerase subunit sigma n=1 Tax=Candidatus Nomurabacteria bacterium RIFCSPLOWO2_01_FULL_33_24 TaxID=1801765 RepID=A0A1F6X024_9BACT|nr:MAG: RNA polymerase subunit sigma [Candidatus Nomurabacteria bacterium RIFCSPLOWO2_01_FULL_33_24]
MRQLKITKSITNRENLSLEKYLQEIGRVTLLTPEEEVWLAKKIKEGDIEALQKLTAANLRFVVSVAKQYQNQGFSLSDLINEGNLGLIKAAQKFDETRGFKFISYAVWWIRQTILQALAEQSRIVRLPLNKVDSLNKINKIFIRLEQEFEREPSPEEIAIELDLSSTEVSETLEVAKKYISFDAPLEEGGEDSLLEITDGGEKTPDTEVMYNQSLSKEIEIILETLSPRQKEILTLYFGLLGKQKMSLEDIGEKTGLTRERVRQIKDKIIIKLRAGSSAKMLKQFLG